MITMRPTYQGVQLPTNTPVKQPIKDLSNNPSYIVIGGLTLPPDTCIYVDGEKVVAESKILDGVSVFERIMRRPYKIEFEMVMRSEDEDGYIFPQSELNDMWNNIWLPDTVQKIQNTHLNGIGILEIVILTVSTTTIRGSKNLPVRMTAVENVPGLSIIIG